jgi:hypothetical protein
MKWTLIKTTQDGAYNKHRKVNETVFHYRADDGREVAFHAHPTRTFVYSKVYGTVDDTSAVLDAFITQGLKQHDYAGGFEEAIKELEVGGSNG